MTYPTYEYPETYQFPAHTPPPKKSSAFWWIIGAVVFALAAAVALGAIVVAKTSAAVSPEQQIIDWRDQASADFLAVADTMQDISDTATQNDLSGLQGACTVLETDLDTAREHLPTPDADLTREISAALDDYTRAAMLCQHMDSGGDVVAVGKYLESGTEHILAANEITDEAEAKLGEEN